MSSVGGHYTYKQYSPITDHIFSALGNLEEEARSSSQASPHLNKPHFPQLGNHVSYFKKNEMQPEIMLVYEKQVRGNALESYGVIKKAAEKELGKENLSIGNRVRLLDAIDLADKKIMVVSKQFYETHPVEKFKTEVKSGLPKLLLEEKALMEKNIQIHVKEKLKNAKKLEGGAQLNLILKEKIENLKLQKNARFPTVSPEELAKLPELEKELAENENDMAKVRTFNELLDSRSTLLVEKLNEILGQIADIQGEKRKKLQPKEFLSFVGEQLSDSSLESASEELLDLSKAYHSQPWLAQRMLVNITTELLGLGRDLIIARNSARVQVLKKRVKQVLPFVAIYALATVIYTYSSAILAGLAAAFASSKAFIIGAAALIGVSNPIGAMILGGVVIFGLGILITKNRAYIAKLFTPLKSAGSYIVQAAVKLFNIVKSKIKPNIHVHFKVATAPKTDEALKRELNFVAENAKDNALKSHLLQDIIQRRRKIKLAGNSLESELNLDKDNLLRKELEFNLIEERIKVRKTNNGAQRLKDEILQFRESLDGIQKKMDSFPVGNEKKNQKPYKKLLAEKAKVESNLNQKTTMLNELVGTEIAEKMLNQVVKFHPRKKRQ